MWLIQKHRPNPIPACGWFSQPSSIGVYLCLGLARFQPETYMYIYICIYIIMYIYISAQFTLVGTTKVGGTFKTGDSTRKLSSRWCMNPSTFFVGSTSIYQAFWCSSGYRAFETFEAYPNMQLPRKDGMTTYQLNLWKLYTYTKHIQSKNNDLAP